MIVFSEITSSREKRRLRLNLNSSGESAGTEDLVDRDSKMFHNKPTYFRVDRL